MDFASCVLCFGIPYHYVRLRGTSGILHKRAPEKDATDSLDLNQINIVAGKATSTVDPKSQKLVEQGHDLPRQVRDPNCRSVRQPKYVVDSPRPEQYRTLLLASR